MKKDFSASVAFHSGNGQLPSVATRSPTGSKLFPIQYLHPQVNFITLFILRHWFFGENKLGRLYPANNFRKVRAYPLQIPFKMPIVNIMCWKKLNWDRLSSPRKCSTWRKMLVRDKQPSLFLPNLQWQSQKVFQSWHLEREKENFKLFQWIQIPEQLVLLTVGAVVFLNNYFKPNLT